MDCSLKPSQRTDLLGRRNKGKRGSEENGGGPLSEPEEGAAHSYSSSCWKNNRKKRRRLEVSGCRGLSGEHNLPTSIALSSPFSFIGTPSGDGIYCKFLLGEPEFCLI